MATLDDVVAQADIVITATGNRDVVTLEHMQRMKDGALLGKSDRTVRQQAVEVYRKSGLSGRAELSAFFLEDLLLPLSPPEPNGLRRSRPERRSS